MKKGGWGKGGGKFLEYLLFWEGGSLKKLCLAIKFCLIEIFYVLGGKGKKKDI